MTEKYIDATASGANDGSSQSDAWESVQEAIDDVSGGALAAGDVVLCRHTASPDEQPTAAIDVDGSSGAIASLITFVGVNSSWVENGTDKYELDFQNASSTHGIDCNDSAVDSTLWKHFEVYNADQDGIRAYTNGSQNHNFINCISRNNGWTGFYTYYGVHGKLFGCLAYGNGRQGFGGTNSGRYICCCSRDNTEEGFFDEFGNDSMFFGCLAFDNTKQGFVMDGDGILINSVSDNNALGNILLGDNYPLLFGNRITNAPATKYGLYGASKGFMSGYNYYQDNAAGNKDSVTGEVFLNQVASTTTDQFDQGDTDAGYTSLTEGSENYELESDATMFENAIQIPTGQ